MADILRTDNEEIEEADDRIIPEPIEEVLSLDGIDEEAQTVQAKPQEEPEKKKQSLIADLFDSFETFCVALVLMMIIFTFVLRFVTVDGGSMNNTLIDQDKLVISNLFYSPETGDILVLNAEGKLSSEKYIIKRVIATGGQTVSIDYESWKVTVDGVLLDEGYVNKIDAPMNAADKKLLGGHNPEGDADIEFTVPEGMLFVMGDNRNKSADSRSVGFFEEERLLGRVLLRISPFDSFGTVE